MVRASRCLIHVLNRVCFKLYVNRIFDCMSLAGQKQMEIWQIPAHRMKLVCMSDTGSCVRLESFSAVV